MTFHDFVDIAGVDMETVCVCGKGYLCDFLKFLCCVVLGILIIFFFCSYTTTFHDDHYYFVCSPFKY